MSDKIDATKIAALLGYEQSDQYQERVTVHMEIVSDLRANPPKEKFRGELPKEAQRRYYWQKKTGVRWSPWEFICAYPMLAKSAADCFKSRNQVIREYFSKSAKEKQKAATPKRERDKRLVNLPVGSMVPVEMLIGPYKGRRGFVTALHPAKGYRATLWPNERWKTKVRRWCGADDLQVLTGRKLPPLPQS